MSAQSRPGHYARRIALGHRVAAVKFVGSAILLILTAGWLVTVGMVLVSVGCTAVAGLLALAGRSRWQRARKASIGAKVEREVAGVLKRRCGAHLVLNNVDLRIGGDADHVVFAPGGVAVVETKAGGGNVRVTADGRLDAGQRTIPGNPIGQVRRQAGAVSDQLGERAVPIVCVQHMRNGPILHGDVTICSAQHLPRVIEGMSGRLDASRSRRLAGRLR